MSILPTIPKELETKKKGKKTKSPTVYDCKKCKLSNNPHSIYGNEKTGLVFVGEAPVTKDIPFSPASMQYLRSSLRRFTKLSLEKNSAIINACSCKIPFNKISDTYLRCCRPKLIENLKQLKPKLIIALGESAINSIMDLLGSKESISKMRNRLIPCYEFDCVLYATLHPEATLGRTKEQLAYTFERDMKRILGLWETKFNSRANVKLFLKKRDILRDSKINEIENEKQLLLLVDKIMKYGSFSFDYEATGLKPYDEFFQLASVAFGLPDRTAYVIYLPKYNGHIKRLKSIVVSDLLNEPQLLKVIQNAKFEELCTRHWVKDSNIYIERSESGQIIRNVFDTMLATHVVDERRGCTSLDFQNLVRFGFKPYSEKTKPYLEKQNKDDKQNRVFECSPDDLIKYTGLDVLSTYANYEVLDKILLNEGNFRSCYDFLLKGHEVFANMTEFGVPVNESILQELNILFTEKQKEVNKAIFNLPEVKSYLDPLQGKRKTLKIANENKPKGKVILKRN